MTSTDAEPQVCRDFLRHACKRGSRCRFSHEATSGTDRPSTSGESDKGCRCCLELVDVGRQSAAAGDFRDGDYKNNDDVITEMVTSQRSR